MVGQAISHYRVIEELGGGGMGVVYGAEDTRLGRPVALKFLPAGVSKDAVAIARFERGARAASFLNHPNICTIYDVDEYQGQHFLVMERLEGETLRRHIGLRPLPLETTLELTLQITEGLIAAHQKGILHRDLKPANIFVTTSGRVKILDFGLAKLMTELRPASPGSSDKGLTSPIEAELTGPGAVLGTVAYMSPEQSLGNELDAGTDLFSLGVVLYQMVTSSLPFTGRTMAAVFDAILHKTPVPPSRLNPETPADLERVIGKALEKDRRLRYQTATDLRADLLRVRRAAGQGQTIGSAGSAGTTASDHTPAIPRRGSVFGPFRLDSAAGQLRRGDAVVPLAPKAFTVLQHLVDRAGQLVTKDELLDLAWADVHVGDGALKVCIREIRRTLQDDPRTPTYIETAHRRGYRFIAPVGTDSGVVPSARITTAPVARSGSIQAIPDTHYARSGDVNIAYQVVGSGSIDLVFVMGWVSHLDYFWAEPSFARFLRRLASFSRLILLDKRGTGLSDRVTELPTLEQRMDDVRAVMEQVGSRQAALIGVSEGGPMCALFAATYPAKTRALIMIGTYAKRLWDPGYPWAPTRAEREAFHQEIQDGWGGPVGLEARAPSMAADPAFRNWWGTYLRAGASPGAALALSRMNAEIDIRDILPSIRVPSLILHRRHDHLLNVEEGRYVAGRIPGARFVELPGEDHLPFVGDQEALIGEIEQFVTGEPVRAPLDRVLATILHARVDGSDTGSYLEHAVHECEWFRGRTFQSDSGRFVAAFDGPARAIRCASALTESGRGFDVRVSVGLHTGECTFDSHSVSGAPVDLAAGIARQASPGEALVSRTVRDLVGDAELPFEDHGLHEIPGLGSWRLFRV
jgi:pimeloyl-ACP methyl ester carboxylesterase/DNA-binding winged helix-turn-helix (wHTH) protein/predicted Ser/Thr protein kinase